jgi:hypothetical protein
LKAFPDLKEADVGIGEDRVGQLPDHSINRAGVESFLGKVLNEKMLAVVEIGVHQNLYPYAGFGFGQQRPGGPEVRQRLFSSG